MTTVAIARYGDTIAVYADDSSTDDSLQTPRADPKAFTTTIFGYEAAIGFTSSYRMGQLIRYELPRALRGWGENKIDPLEAMVTRYIPELRKVLKENGYTKIESNEEKGGVFVVGWLGRIFMIDSDFQVCETSLDYMAVGSGREYALGALAYGWLDVDSEEALRTLLRSVVNIAGRFDPYTGHNGIVVRAIVKSAVPGDASQPAV